MQTTDYKSLYKRLGYTFEDQSLIDLALRHRSMGEINNERLEFLGDSIVNFIIGSELFTRYSDAHEGHLTRMRAQLVCGSMLAEIAKEMHLGDFVVLGEGERKTGGHQRSSILEDLVEAIIGAIYLDVDEKVTATREVVLPWFEDKFAEVYAHAEDKDPKTILQELLQSQHLELPEYEIVKTTGKEHEQTFYVSCSTELTQKPVQGVGSNRRKAEQDAAYKILEQLGKL